MPRHSNKGMKMNKDNLKKKRTEIVVGFIYFILVASFVLLMFDSNPDNNLVGTGGRKTF